MSEVNAILWLMALPMLTTPVIYLAGRLYLRYTGKSGLSRWLAFFSLLATGVILSYVTQFHGARGDLDVLYGNILLRVDGISLLLAWSVVGLGLLVTLFSFEYMKGEVNEEKFYALLVAMAGSMIGLGCAGDLFNLWVWFEAMAVTSYMLVAFYFDQKSALEAGIKYIVQSATGSVLVLIGIALVFSYTGTLKIPDLVAMQSVRTPVLLAAGAFFLVGYGVKSALVPLHTWLPDAHSQAPSGISAMLSGVVIEAGLIALLRSLGSLGNTSATWGALLLAFGAVNMIVGNLMALRQNQVKRLLAYSSVSHIGYMLLGFGVSLAFQHPQGASGAFFHLFNHALMKGLAFLAAGAMLYGLHIARGEHTPLLVEDLNGASRRYPWAAFTFSIAVLGLGGLPPLAGFMSKWQIFTAGFSLDNVSQNSVVSTLVLLIFIFMAVNSVLSLAYYAPLVNRLYRREPSAIVLTGKRLSWTMQLPLMILAAAIVVLGCWPSLLDWLTGPAASSLMASFGI